MNTSSDCSFYKDSEEADWDIILCFAKKMAASAASMRMRVKIA
jgi:hypothetical protein